MNAALLSINNVSVAYAGKPVVSEVSLSVAPGEIICLLGPSGCGKTSLLRAIAGFEPLQAGTIALSGVQVSAPGFTLAPEQRRVGMMFQDFALFPHLSVYDNMAFGLRGLSAAQQAQRVHELAELVDLSQQLKAFPHQLSGGQQQRVALARALAPGPSVLLMDEPFSAIDPELREQLADDIRTLLKRDGTTAIVVTHDQTEAFAVADRIAVLGGGRLRQVDTAYQLYHEPADRFVADFIGHGTLIEAKVLDEYRVNSALGLIESPSPHGAQPGETVDVLVRPDDVVHDDESPWKLAITHKAFRGATYLYSLQVSANNSIVCLVHSHHDHEVGEALGVRLDMNHLSWFPRA